MLRGLLTLIDASYVWSMHAIAGYAVFCFLNWLIYHDRQRFLDAWRSRCWLPVRAVVTNIQDHEFELDAADKYQGSYVARHSSRFYNFRYSVNGLTYKAGRYSFEGDVRGSPELDVGRHVTIYFDPSCPQKAVVRRGFTWVMLFVPFAALSALAWALGHSVLL